MSFQKVVKPVERKPVATYLMNTFGLSQRRACQLNQAKYGLAISMRAKDIKTKCSGTIKNLQRNIPRCCLLLHGLFESRGTIQQKANLPSLYRGRASGAHQEAEKN